MITLGTTAPTGAAENAMGGAGRMYTTAYVLSGAPAGSYFSAIRLRVHNAQGGSAAFRAVVYDNSNNRIDWAAYTMAATFPDQIVTVPLLGAVVVANGTYKIGIQGEFTGVNFWLATSGVATTTYYWTTAAGWGSVPPNPWTPTGSIAWQVACAADVSAPAGAAFVPQIIIT